MVVRPPVQEQEQQQWQQEQWVRECAAKVPNISRLPKLCKGTVRERILLMKVMTYKNTFIT